MCEHNYAASGFWQHEIPGEYDLADWDPQGRFRPEHTHHCLLDVLRSAAT
jgi:hypothetical protein